MYLSIKKLLVVAAIIAYLILTWFLATWLHLAGSRAWLLRLVMLGVGLAAFGVILWWSRGRQKPAPETGTSPAGGPVPDEIGYYIRAAQDKLKRSQVRGATIGTLPAVFLIGESGSGKTCAVVNCGLDPEHLAGRLIENTEIVPTGSLNLWFARQAIFVEAAGPLLNDPAGWTYLVRRLAPARLLSVLAGRRQASRAAVVCLDCETFTRSASIDSITSAAKVLQSRLREASAILGASLPVYVLVTKADAISFFAEYAATLSNSEAAQVLGVTLPVQDYRTGLYAQEQAERLTQAFDQIFYSLAHHRIEYLAREQDPGRWPGIYEFPREFRKLRAPLVQMLVELCRPSQLNVGPFLRGFYFTGVRMVLEETNPAAARAPRPTARPAEAASGATQMFNLAALQQATQAEQGAAGGLDQPGRTHWVPQWSFLSHIFSDVLLQDRAALGASASSTKVGFWRRFLLATAAVIFLVCLVGFTVSFFGNRSLESRVEAAASATFTTPSAGQAPSASDLQRLNEIGRLLDELSGYRRGTPPLGLKWGLFVGNDLYPAACRAYARGFETLLLAPAQTAMVTGLKGLRFKQPYDPNADPWDDPYNKLETYLITTGDGSHAKEDPALSSDLYNQWFAGRTIGTDQEAPAKREFDFYSAQLAGGVDCFDHRRDNAAVETARSYLTAFPAEQRIYQNMLSEAASKGGKGIDFNKQGYADSVVSDSYIIRPAFTREGWKAMQNALANPEQYGSAAAWVLGAQTIADPQSYKAALEQHYEKDFAGEWRAFLRSARFRSSTDTTRMINTVAGARSALLMVLCLASEHTSDTSVVNAFTAPRAFVPPNCEANVIGLANKPYTDSLFNLQDCLQKADLAPTPDAKSTARQNCGGTGLEASSAVERLIAQNAGSDAEVNKATQALLLAPINTLKGQTKAPPPLGAADLCSGLRTLVAQFPSDVALAELQGIFGPDGSLGKFKPPPEKPNPRYLSFYQRATAIQQALYPDGKTLRMHYTITALASPGVTSFTLTIGGQSLSAFNSPKEFVWTGNAQETVQLAVGALSTTPETGALDIFRFVDDNAESGSGQLGPQGYSFSIRAGQTLGRQTTPGRLNLRINAGTASILFENGWAARLQCTAKMTQ